MPRASGMRANLTLIAAHLRPRSVLREPSLTRCAAKYSPRLAGGLKPRPLSYTRNVGIIAHIDAGKTTTTERMIYYSGYTYRIGNVDEGSTVTDFLEAERARGITIQAAAITFHWPPYSPHEPVDSYNINLIDTPGHADFTFEVLRSLRVLDGAICILDGVAGVEAQTEKVWQQANAHRIPRIIYVNKLDREGAAFGRTVSEVAIRLRGWPAVCQVPWWADGYTRLAGVGDVIGLRGLWWEKGGDGKDFDTVGLADLRQRDASLADELCKARVALVELISEHDDELVTKFLECGEDHLAIMPNDLWAALRRCVLRSPQAIFPVFAGASFRNVGVQPLLDAIGALLPSPEERPSPRFTAGGLSGSLQELTGQTPSQGAKSPHKPGARLSKAESVLSKPDACALAFKVVHDAEHGTLVYVRVYSGAINKNHILYNTSLGKFEKAHRLFRMYASKPLPVATIEAGHIGVLPGIKHARTGDTLLFYTGASLGWRDRPQEPFASLQLKPIEVPPPLFFTSVQASSLSDEKHLHESLSLLLREDPSLSVSEDTETGQTHLSGMGELHLEIARDRLLSDFKAKGRVGNIEISYRETILGASSPVTEIFDREVARKRVKASSSVSVRPREDGIGHIDGTHTTVMELPDNNILIIEHPKLTKAGKSSTRVGSDLPAQFSMAAVLDAVKNGAAGALARGPKYAFPVHSASITVEFDHESQMYPETTLAAISSAVRLATRSALRAASEHAGSVLMEPVMLVTIDVGEADLGAVVHDLSSARGGQVLSLDAPSSSHVEDPDAAGTANAGSAEEAPVIDLSRVYRPPDPFESNSSGLHGAAASPTMQRQIVAKVPLKEMVGYLKHLRSLTGGRGTFVMKVDRFERVGGQRMKQILAELHGSEM